MFKVASITVGAIALVGSTLYKHYDIKKTEQRAQDLYHYADLQEQLGNEKLAKQLRMNALQTNGSILFK